MHKLASLSSSNDTKITAERLIVTSGKSHSLFLESLFIIYQLPVHCISHLFHFILCLLFSHSFINYKTKQAITNLISFSFSRVHFGCSFQIHRFPNYFIWLCTIKHLLKSVTVFVAPFCVIRLLTTWIIVKLNGHDDDIDWIKYIDETVLVYNVRTYMHVDWSIECNNGKKACRLWSVRASLELLYMLTVSAWAIIRHCSEHNLASCYLIKNLSSLES